MDKEAEIRLKLEQAILKCGNTTDDIDMFYEEFLDGETRMTDDDVANTLIGVSKINDLRVNRAFKLFEEYIKAVHSKTNTDE